MGSNRRVHFNVDKRNFNRMGYSEVLRMNKMKPEDVMRACDRAQPSDERSALREYRRRIYEAVNYRGTDDHEDVTTILLEYKKAILREKDAEIERLKKHLDYKCVYGYDGEVMEFCVQGPCPHYNMEKQVRVDAVTEFAERLKAKLIAGGIYPVIVKNAIDQIAKGMKGEGATHGE